MLESSLFTARPNPKDAAHVRLSTTSVHHLLPLTGWHPEWKSKDIPLCLLYTCFQFCFFSKSWVIFLLTLHVGLPFLELTFILYSPVTTHQYNIFKRRAMSIPRFQAPLSWDVCQCPEGHISSQPERHVGTEEAGGERQLCLQVQRWSSLRVPWRYIINVSRKVGEWDAEKDRIHPLCSLSLLH